MKRLFIPLILLLLPIGAAAQRYDGLDSLLTGFYTALERAPLEEKTAEFDALIASCRDSLTRQHVATEIFDHYKDAPVMGDEEISVHIYDRWFADGTVKMAGEFSLMDARMFADFNRSTLIGCDAPQVVLIKPGGAKVSVPEKGRTAILFFYDTECAKCRLEAKVLPGILESIDFPVRFYAVYSGSDRKSWNRFRREFRVRNTSVRVEHFWDPGIDSDFIRWYGVISTPRMYLMEPSGSIIGRRLEPESLQQILPLAKQIATIYETQKTTGN